MACRCMTDDWIEDLVFGSLEFCEEPTKIRKKAYERAYELSVRTLKDRVLHAYAPEGGNNRKARRDAGNPRFSINV